MSHLVIRVVLNFMTEKILNTNLTNLTNSICE